MIPTFRRQVQTASRSDVGRVRSVNQDAWAELENADGYRLLIVADGMGGHRGGETASRLTVEAVQAVFDRDFGDPDTLLVRALRAANERVHQLGSSDPALHGMGTTGVALLIGPADAGWVAHVGDSRAYRLRDGHFAAITEDHSWIGEAVRHGRISADDAVHHPMKNVLLRSIGVGAVVEISGAAIDLRPGDRFLLCSDGLWSEVDDAAIAGLLARESPSNAVDALVDLANARGGSDNVTVLIAALSDAEPAPAIALGLDGPTEVPETRAADAQPWARLLAGSSRAPGERPVWTRPIYLAAGLVAATALVWRICA
jgi:serine/threonine protein phosphatase PrpC